MANSDKNIIITPNTGTSSYPTISFTGSNASPITMSILDTGALSFSGTSGQLFSIVDSLSGSIFSINDISGIPSVEVLDTGLVKLNQYGGSTVISGSTAIQNSSSVNAKLSIYTKTATIPGLIIKAAPSQSANLQEWQDSTGALAGRISSSGAHMYMTYYEASSQIKANYEIMAGGINAVGALNARSWGPTVITAVIRGAASQTASLQEWQSSSASVLAKIDNVGVGYFTGIYAGAASFSGVTWNGISNPTGATTLPSLVVKGITSQTANLQEWQDSAGTVLSYIRPNGGIYSLASDDNRLYNLGIGGSSNGISWLYVTPQIASQKPIVIRGAASQTANIQEWQNSAGTTLTSITANGVLAIGNFELNSNFGATFYNKQAAFYNTSNTTAYTGAINFARGTSGGAWMGLGTTGDTLQGVASVDLRDGNNNALFSVGNTGNTSINIQATTSVGLNIKAIASQSAHLQQWQDGNGNNLGYFNKDGNMAIYNLFRGYGYQHVNGVGAYFNSNADNGGFRFYTNGAANKGIVITAATSQTANLQEWQDGTGTVLAKVDYAGAINTGQSITAAYGGFGLLIAGATISSRANSASEIPMLIRGAASQTANLQEWQQSDASVPTAIDSAGKLRVRTFGYMAGASLDVSTASSGNAGIIVKGVASQTSDLQQWQNSAGTALGRFLSDGTFRLNGVYNNASSTLSIGDTAYGFSAEGAYLRYWTASNSLGGHIFYGGSTSSSPGRLIIGNNGNTVIAGVSNQSLDLLSIKNVSGTVLAAINSSGNIAIGQNYTSYAIETSKSLYSKNTITNNLYVQGGNNLLYPSTITSAGGNGWASVTPNYGVAPDGTTTSTRYTWTSFGNCFVTTNTITEIVNQTYTASMYFKKNSGSGSFVISMRTADSSKTMDLVVSLSTLTISTSQSGSDYTFISSSITDVGAGWYRLSLTAKSLVSHNNFVFMFAANGGVTTSDIEIWGAQLEYGNVASSLTPTTNAFVTNLNSINIPYGTLFVQSSASSTPLTIKSAASQTADLTYWQDSSGNAISLIDSSGAFKTGSIIRATAGGIFGGTTQLSTALTVYAQSATQVGQIIRGAASQTADLQQWQNSAGTVLSSISSSGMPFFNNTMWSNGIFLGDRYNWNYSATINILNASDIPAILIRAHGAQTANLQEWRNNSGSTVLASIGSGGVTTIYPTTSTQSSLIVKTDQAWNSAVDPNYSNIAVLQYQTNANIVSGNIGGRISFGQRFWNGNAAAFNTGMIGSIKTTADGDYGGGLTFHTSNNSPSIATYERMRIDHLGNVLINGFTSSTVGLTIKGASSQTADLQQWQNSAGTVLTKIASDGAFTINPSGNSFSVGANGVVVSNNSMYIYNKVYMGQYTYFNSFLNVSPQATTESGIVIRGLSSQTANLQEWQNSGGTALVAINSYGQLRATGSGALISSGSAANVGLYVDGYASQTGDLQQWRDNAANILAKVDKDGLITSSTTGDSGWIQITSFTNSFTATNNVYYRKLNNVVWIRGSVSGGTANTSAFTLPAGYRPSTGWVAATQEYGTSNITYVTIQADGTCTPIGSATWFNISFPIG